MTSAAPLLPWHEPAWRTMCTSLEEGRLAHALLLTGAAGMGKRCLAERLARLLLCAMPVATAQGLHPCGRCDACAAMRRQAHPGYRLLQRAADARDISVDAVRDGCAFLALTGAAARARVLVVDRADDLNDSGVNALLKTVEEPAPDAYVVLLSESPDLLPATLRSRCQTIRLSPPPNAEALAYLEGAAPESDATERQLALDEALGAPLRALQLLAEPSRLERLAQWAALLESLWRDSTQPLDSPPLPGTASADRERATEYGRHAAVWAWRQSRRALEAGAAPRGAVRTEDEALRLISHLHTNARPGLAMDSFLIAMDATAAADRLVRDA